jgi:hypothetical protein
MANNVPVFPNACNPDIPPNTIVFRPWSRARGQPCQLTNGITSKELDWRRKYEILQYKQRGNSQTKAQYYKRVATNTVTRRSKTYANQNLNMVPKNTNPNTQNLPVVNNTLVLTPCPQIDTWTYGADVPGPAMKLTPVPDVPLTRFNPERKTYRGGAEKWPQWGWYRGANGFPVRKKGKK